MNAMPAMDESGVENLLVDSDLLLGVLLQARQLLDWEGESIVPGGPEQSLIDYMTEHQRAARPLVLALLHTFRRLYGAGVARSRRQVRRYSQAVEEFVKHYGSGKLALARAPARINVLGEHVDYVRYLPTEVLPFASREHDMLILFRPTEAARVRGRSTLEGAEAAAFDLSDGPRADEGTSGPVDDGWLAYLRGVGTPRRHWINYVKAAVFFCQMKHPDIRRGFDFLLDSTIPAAGGASSSSAIMVLASAATAVVNGLPLEATALAEDSARAEWYIGTRGGNMDHCTMCLSRRQSALHLNFSPFRTQLVPLHRFRYRWVTFFAHPADKSSDVLLKYNERSAVSRLLIPALLEKMLAADVEARIRWQRAVRTLARDRQNVLAAEEAREILRRLPESVTLAEVERDFPSAYREIERSYPDLVAATGPRPLKLRPRALHHAGEVVRVREVVRILNEIFSSRMPEEPEKTEPGLRAVGDLITETHVSMRDLYELTTPDIDELIEIILSHPGVYGARLMGGGFGGNVLVLMSKEHVAELVRRVQEQYYLPRGRNALAEGSVMVNTPGEGFGTLCLRDVLRRSIINASAIWWKWESYAPVIERVVCELLRINAAREFAPVRPIQPVVVAGGRGELKMGSGYRSPAALNVLNDKTSLEHVLDAVSGMPFATLPPIVVISPAMRGEAIERIKFPKGTRTVVQEEPRGTGHAVKATLDDIEDTCADVLVVWGSQPLLSSGTLARSIMVHQALESAAMLFPTAVTRTPYAPIERDLHGYVIASLETATQSVPTRQLGETNVGAFVISAENLVQTLPRIHNKLWDQHNRRYATKSGELGFPNEMARALVHAGKPVIALPVARVEESLGLRNVAGYEQVKRIMAERAGAAPPPA